MHQAHDVIVMGGGMVGCAVALMLTQAGYRTTIIERHDLDRSFDPGQPHDIRISAIQRSSEKLLKKLGVWESLQATRIYPFNKMLVQDWTGFSSTLDAKDSHEANLGHLLENQNLANILWQKLLEHPLSNCLIAQCTHLQRHSSEGWLLQLDSGQVLTAPLLIGVDGAQSQVRQWLNLEQNTQDYQQHCIVGNVKTEKPHHQTCYQHYSQTGIFALLPLSERECSIAWYVSAHEAASILNSDTQTISHLLNQASDKLLGQITPVSSLSSFPLIRRQTHHYVQPGVLLMGDAAHTVHPQAGQGVNLGFLDVLAFMQIVDSAQKHQHAIHDIRILKQFERARHHDATLVQSGMEAFNWFFSNRPINNQLRSLLSPIAQNTQLSAGISQIGLHGRLTGWLS